MSHTTAAQDATIEELLDQFRHYLGAHDRSPYSTRVYPGLHQFANWSTEYTSEPLAWKLWPSATCATSVTTWPRR
jgi:hypothetical protein